MSFIRRFRVGKGRTTSHTFIIKIRHLVARIELPFWQEVGLNHGKCLKYKEAKSLTSKYILT